MFKALSPFRLEVYLAVLGDLKGVSKSTNPLG